MSELEYVYVYIIYSSSFDKYYIGSTKNIMRRLNEHNTGQNLSTKPFKPYEYSWITAKKSRNEAEILERKLKNFKSKNRLKDFMRKYPSLDIKK